MKLPRSRRTSTVPAEILASGTGADHAVALPFPLAPRPTGDR
jgi:hypothetical protein